MVYRAWSGAKLFVKVISRQQKSQLAGKELRVIPPARREVNISLSELFSLKVHPFALIMALDKKGMTINIFLILHENITCGHWLEALQGTASVCCLK